MPIPGYEETKKELTKNLHKIATFNSARLGSILCSDMPGIASTFQTRTYKPTELKTLKDIYLSQSTMDIKRNLIPDTKTPKIPKHTVEEQQQDDDNHKREIPESIRGDNQQRYIDVIHFFKDAGYPARLEELIWVTMHQTSYTSTLGHLLDEFIFEELLYSQINEASSGFFITKVNDHNYRVICKEQVTKILFLQQQPHNYHTASQHEYHNNLTHELNDSPLLFTLEFDIDIQQQQVSFVQWQLFSNYKNIMKYIQLLREGYLTTYLGKEFDKTIAPRINFEEQLQQLRAIDVWMSSSNNGYAFPKISSPRLLQALCEHTDDLELKTALQQRLPNTIEPILGMPRVELSMNPRLTSSGLNKKLPTDSQKNVILLNATGAQLTVQPYLDKTNSVNSAFFLVSHNPLLEPAKNIRSYFKGGELLIDVSTCPLARNIKYNGCTSVEISLTANDFSTITNARYQWLYPPMQSLFGYNHTYKQVTEYNRLLDSQTRIQVITLMGEDHKQKILTLHETTRHHAMPNYSAVIHFHAQHFFINLLTIIRLLQYGIAIPDTAKPFLPKFECRFIINIPRDRQNFDQKIDELRNNVAHLFKTWLLNELIKLWSDNKLNQEMQTNNPLKQSKLEPNETPPLLINMSPYRTGVVIGHEELMSITARIKLTLPENISKLTENEKFKFFENYSWRYAILEDHHKLIIESTEQRRPDRNILKHFVLQALLLFQVPLKLETADKKKLSIDDLQQFANDCFLVLQQWHLYYDPRKDYQHTFYQYGSRFTFFGFDRSDNNRLNNVRGWMIQHQLLPHKPNPDTESKPPCSFCK